MILSPEWISFISSTLNKTYKTFKTKETLLNLSN